jgi:hypothetical protein
LYKKNDNIPHVISPSFFVVSSCFSVGEGRRRRGRGRGRGRVRGNTTHKKLSKKLWWVV